MNNKDKILKQLFEKPAKEFHIRLLARLTKLNPNTIINITNDFIKEGLVIKRKDKERNITIVKANTQNIFYKIKKQSYNIEKIHKSKLINFINEKLAYPTIILFGSYAKAENHEKSDIDLFIISEEKKKLNLNKFEQKLETSIQLFIYTKEEFQKAIKKNPELINNMINGIILSGFLEVF